MQKRQPQWSSRFALIFASIALIVGTGVIWRFPRNLAEHGGSFLIGWALFLFLWSIPLIMIEMVIGRKTRMGTSGSFRDFVHEKYTWMGTVVFWVAAFATFYTSVVTGWTLKYLLLTFQGAFFKDGVDTGQIWDTFSTNAVDMIVFHILVAVISGFVLYLGINTGVERANQVMIPLLFLTLIFTTIYTLNLEGSIEGIKYMFTPEWNKLTNAETWLAALSQSAWSTGAGWGIFATYAIYTKKNEDIAQNTLTATFGNNSAELMAGLTIIPAIFVLSPSPAYLETALGSDNYGMIFVYMAELFTKMSGGFFVSIVFFTALALAAISSLIGMFVFLVRNIEDFGVPYKKAVIMTVVVTIILGIPSAVSLDFLGNQDFVWGLGLIINAMFYLFAAYQYGIEKIRDEINEVSDIKLGRWYIWIVKYCMPVIAVVFFGWWIYQSIVWYPSSWWSPKEIFSFGSFFVQVGSVIVISILFNRWVKRNIRRQELSNHEEMNKEVM
ncbi:sodium-dependent transporter [Bacillus norwichensis]|uniref:Sodium-dependent transporter n=1 Tax=Bacillus norwichensis TaxID=2762217 RepID=A0ABR8VIN5_9BACI|nr:sodium-dependent transporter [Bacillus norwichensis]MBD8004537.1 sodium-dependent transporter [Bacillus norwichensis]